MKRTISVAVIAWLLCPVIVTGQVRTGQGAQRSGEGEKHPLRPSAAQTTQGRPAEGSAVVHRKTDPPAHSSMNPHATVKLERSPLHGPTMGGPITQPVDLPQPIPVFAPFPVTYYPWMEVPPPHAIDLTYEPPASHPPRTIVATTIGNCIDDPAHAGYCFANRSIVSCEDSTVDFYLSYGDSSQFAFLVPHDTDVKDAGYHMSVLDVVRFKPTDWSPEHMVRIEGGHVYIVWANTDEFFLVRVNSISKGRAAIEWVRHSRLSREEVLRHQKGEESPAPPAPDRGPVFPR